MFQGYVLLEWKNPNRNRLGSHNFISLPHTMPDLNDPNSEKNSLENHLQPCFPSFQIKWADLFNIHFIVCKHFQFGLISKKCLYSFSVIFNTFYLYFSKCLNYFILLQQVFNTLHIYFRKFLNHFIFILRIYSQFGIFLPILGQYSPTIPKKVPCFFLQDL